MFISQAYLQSISEEKRRQIMRSQVSLGYHPETDDMSTIVDVDRYVGTYVLGVQGVGKSGLLENLIAFDIQAGNAVIVIDPLRGRQDVGKRARAISDQDRSLAFAGSTLSQTSLAQVSDSRPRNSKFYITNRSDK